MQHFVADQEPATLKGYRLDRNGGHDVIEAQIVENGREYQLHGKGEGALSAFVDGWMRHSGHKMNVVDYSEHAIGSGTDAEAVAYIQLNIEGQRVSGVALDHDTVSASLKALLSAMNRAQVKRTQVA